MRTICQWLLIALFAIGYQSSLKDDFEKRRADNVVISHIVFLVFLLITYTAGAMDSLLAWRW